MPIALSQSICDYKYWEHRMKIRIKNSFINRFQHNFVKILFVGTIIVLITHIIHTVYHPLIRPLDLFFHSIFVAGYFIYYLALYIVFVYIAERISANEFIRKYSVLLSYILIIILVAEVIYNVTALPRIGSSYFQPLFPEFLSGILVSVFCIFAISTFEFKHSSFRYFAYIIAFFWCLFPTIIDLDYATQKVPIEKNPFWYITLIDMFLHYTIFLLLYTSIICAPFYFFSESLGFFFNYTYKSPNLDIPIFITFFLLFIIFGRFKNPEFFKKQKTAIPTIALSFAASFIFSLLPMWVNYFLD